MNTPSIKDRPASASTPPPSQRPMLVWEVGKTFRHEPSGGYVSVKTAKTPGRTIFSMSMGVRRLERETPFIPIFFTQESLRLTSAGPEPQFNYSLVYHDLIELATAWILEEGARELAAKQDEAYERDAKKAAFGQPKTAHTGKTQKNRERRAAKV